MSDEWRERKKEKAKNIAEARRMAGRFQRRRGTDIENTETQSSRREERHRAAEAGV
jgi:hypothetical protein